MSTVIGQQQTNNIADGAVTTPKQSTAARTRIWRGRLRKAPVLTGSNQTLNAYCFTATQALTIVSARIISSNATTGSTGVDCWGFTLRNLTTGNNLASTPTTTNGGELTADTPKIISVNQNQAFAVNDQVGMQYIANDTGEGGPTNLNAADVDVEIEYTI